MPRECSIARALDVVGEKWSLLVIREVLLGSLRFNEIQANTGAPRDILSDRLRKLVASGILERSVYQERPPRYEYRLTAAGT
ncbi:MAG TPA: helix-turn-helix domain-containing protein, partial [Tepidiformaceae bacterium]|nr:helix-turn-helix domain-containing protein [Tepidiformaceae bacterium]